MNIWAALSCQLLENLLLDQLAAGQPEEASVKPIDLNSGKVNPLDEDPFIELQGGCMCHIGMCAPCSYCQPESD